MKKKKHVLLEHIVSISEYYLIRDTCRASSMFKRSFFTSLFQICKHTVPYFIPVDLICQQYMNSDIKVFCTWLNYVFSLKYIKYQEFDKPLVIVQVRFVQKEIITFSL